MSGYWEFRTPHGAFRVVPSAGRYTAAFEEESLGSYFTAEQALDDLVGGSTVWPSVGDPREFGLPDDLSEWDFVHR
jgi:hypothetical protein